MRHLFLIAATLALSGCVSTEELATRDDAACQARGAKVGTEGYVTCRNLMTQERTAERRLMAARLMVAGQAMKQAGAQMQAAQMQSTNTGFNSTPAPPIPNGFTKVCRYNTITGPIAITIGAIELCPLTYP